MNQSHLLAERMQEYRATELQKRADNERLAQESKQESPERSNRRLLAKFTAEFSNVADKAQANKPKQR